jgi:hypothetical protein
MTPCELVKRHHSLEGTCCLHRHGRNKKFWEELIAYFPLIWHKPHRKGRVQQFIVGCVVVAAVEFYRAVA